MKTSNTGSLKKQLTLSVLLALLGLVILGGFQL